MNRDQSAYTVLRVVALAHGLDTEMIRSRCKRRPIADARHIVCWFLHKRLRWPLTAIGCFLNGRHHTTVLQSIALVQRQLRNPDMRDAINAIGALLPASLDVYSGSRLWLPRVENVSVMRTLQIVGKSA